VKNIIELFDAECKLGVRCSDVSLWKYEGDDTVRLNVDGAIACLGPDHATALAAALMRAFEEGK